MISIKNYSIEEYPTENKLVIMLPQTAKSVRSTTLPGGDRRLSLSDQELAAILFTARAMYEKRITE